MEFIVGIRTKDFVLVASDMNTVRSIVCMKNDKSKSEFFGTEKVVACFGEAGMDVTIRQYLKVKYDLYLLENGYSMTTSAFVSAARYIFTRSLTSPGSVPVNMLIGGFDSGFDRDAELYLLDYLGTKVSVPFGCHGYGAMFALSVLDHYYREGMTEEEALDLVKKIHTEISLRFIVNMPKFEVKILRRDRSTREEMVA